MSDQIKEQILNISKHTIEKLIKNDKTISFRDIVTYSLLSVSPIVLSKFVNKMFAMKDEYLTKKKYGKVVSDDDIYTVQIYNNGFYLGESYYYDAIVYHITKSQTVKNNQFGGAIGRYDYSDKRNEHFLLLPKDVEKNITYEFTYQGEIIYITHNVKNDGVDGADKPDTNHIKNLDIDFKKNIVVKSYDKQKLYDFIIQIKQEYIDVQKGFNNEPIIYSIPSGYDWYSRYLSIHKTYENVVLSQDVERTLRKAVDYFTSQQSKDDAMRLGKPHKLCLLLSGQPGCGKSSISYLLSKLLNYPIYICPVDKIQRIKSTKSIIVFEEIDTHTALHRREEMKEVEEEEIDDNSSTGTDVGAYAGTKKNINININDHHNESNKLLSEVLEFLDGYNTYNGNIIIMTTNCVKKIDPAITRYGRIDHHLEIKYPDVDQQKRLCDLYDIDHKAKSFLIDEKYRGSVTSYIHKITNTDCDLI